MKLNKEKFEQHINTKWNNKICPMCHSNQWTYDETILTPVSVDEKKGMVLGGKFFPLIAVTCVECGNTIFVNGLVAGAIDDEPKNTEV